MDNSLSIALRYQFQKDMMKQQLLDREEREHLVNEICEEVISRMAIKIEAEAISQLRDLLNGFGRY
jgi:hypothetical protein